MANDIVGSGWTFPPRIDAQGGISLTNDRSEIDQAILIILSTSLGQREMRPTFGCRLDELVFAPNDGETAAQARRYVEGVIVPVPKKTICVSVHVGPDPDAANRLLIEVEYQIKATHDKRSLVYPFYLIPEE